MLREGQIAFRVGTVHPDNPDGNKAVLLALVNMVSDNQNDRETVVKEYIHGWLRYQITLAHCLVSEALDVEWDQAGSILSSVIDRFHQKESKT